MNQHMADSFPDYVVTYGIPIGTTIASLGMALNERHKRKKAEAREQANERELEDIKRRGGGPYLQKYALMTGQPSHTIEGEYKGPLPAANQVFQLVLSNANGQSVRGVAFDLPVGWSLFHGCRRGVIEVRDTEIILQYPYDRSKHGAVQCVRINFETFDGIKSYHVYEVRHGFCEFRRIDPA